ncbi:MAG: DNA photolyase FAD-binding protein [Candidatus Saccharibacteria bacterium]|nr:DNA photolyase FAD-binding protein [Moraxellaceae bacterium]
MSRVTFSTNRADALLRLHDFVPHAGRDYASGRNTDFGPHVKNHVSQLSPYLRHRLITEKEVVAAVLRQHDMASAEKYVQEVLWRTYWKGWLEVRPDVWRRFCIERDLALQTSFDAHAITAAENGLIGIEGFDDWARELVETGYLHNHARMWFASIWIFTLRLPWTLGADFFLRHLIDADPASNTLSWRWVAGLQTKGKTYLATTDNIARYTNGRFVPQGLAKSAVALTEVSSHTSHPIRELQHYDDNAPAMLLVTHEDLNPESFISGEFKAACVATATHMLWGEKSAQFVQSAAMDTAQRIQSHYHCETRLSLSLDAESLLQIAEEFGVKQITTAYTPIGPVADVLSKADPILEQSGITLSQTRRSWDTHFWPHAKKGFFAFKEQMVEGLITEGVELKT